jgi:hypothetical protein
MTLEEINDIEDKGERLERFKEYLREKLSDAKIFDKFEAAGGHESDDPGDDRSLRDEAGGMMSKFGKMEE